MLIRFEASNFRSIAAPVELSMVAIDSDRPGARDQPALNESLLSVAAIFGPNASGKSNLIHSFAWLRDAVQNSLRIWDDFIPVDPFAFADGELKPSYFVLEYIIDGVRFEYALELDAEKVHYEALFHYPEKKRRRIFEREGEELKLQRGLGSLSGTRDLLTERTLALSIARRFDEPLINRFSRKLLRTQTMGTDPRRGGGYGVRGMRTLSSYSTNRWFDDRDREQQMSLFNEPEALLPNSSGGDRKQALALLRLADLGIEDVVVDTQRVTASGDPRESYVQTRIRLLHRTENGLVPLEFGAESEGTKTWYRIIGPLLSALRTGSLLLFDELDASLHPTLSAQLIHLFQDPTTNPRGAQLVFTSHDTSLLNHLNRDEVWLTEKRLDGSTRLGSLSEFASDRVRRSQNLENAYLHGRFGALPQVDQADFLRAIGLIG